MGDRLIEIRGADDPAFRKPASFDRIVETALRLDSSILEYFVLNDKLVIWLITKEGDLHTKVVDVKKSVLDGLINRCYLGLSRTDLSGRRVSREAFFELLKSAKEELRRKTPEFNKKKNSSSRGVAAEARENNNETTAHMTELHELLLPGEIESNIDLDSEESLLIVPHGRLSLIPICALQDENGKHLIESVACHQVPGVGVLLVTREIIRQVDSKEQNRKSAILYGNPEMPKWGNTQLPPLRGAEKEVIEIAALLNSDFSVKEKASEWSFKQKAPQRRVIHLATHGISVDAAPIESFIALTPGEGEDGLLTAAEILQMKFDADLAVLSACETGFGRITYDGVEGLVRSFVAGGVPSIVISLWPVHDEATRELMVVFYKSMMQGLDKAEALRKAQLSLMQSKKWNNPTYWSAFVLYGEKDYKYGSFW